MKRVKSVSFYNPTTQLDQEKPVKMTMTALLLALTMLPAFAQSDDPATTVHDYTYVDISYQHLDIDDVARADRDSDSQAQYR